jgi:glycosyltransferase involved in cell wall biosynthesis
VDGGLATLVALGAKWRAGVPFVLTEHDLYLHGPLMHRAGGRPAVRAVLLRFLRALTRLGYAEAAAIAPPSERMRRWALHHGASADLLRVVPPGVDPHDYPVLRDEPEEPAVVWVGPESELPMVLPAFAALRRAVPEARLIVIGPAPPGQRPDGVSFTGPVTARRALYGMGRLVAISGAHEAMPYPLIEAMLCGRATICTDNGGLAATVGVGALVVPPGDPARLAAACASVLTDQRLRHELAVAGRDRARTLFSLSAMLDGYRAVYAQAQTRQPAPDERLARTTGVAS